jgi:hypothetical protein
MKAIDLTRWVVVEIGIICIIVFILKEFILHK